MTEQIKINKLKNIKTDNELVKSVFSIVLENLDEPTDEHLERYVSEILQYGCKSGIVPQLLFCSDTSEFLKTHLDDIFYIINESDVNVSPLNVDEISWLGFELTLRNNWDMLDDLQ